MPKKKWGVWHYVAAARGVGSTRVWTHRGGRRLYAYGNAGDAYVTADDGRQYDANGLEVFMPAPSSGEVAALYTDEQWRQFSADERREANQRWQDHQQLVLAQTNGKAFGGDGFIIPTGTTALTGPCGWETAIAAGILYVRDPRTGASAPPLELQLGEAAKGEWFPLIWRGRRIPLDIFVAPDRVLGRWVALPFMESISQPHGPRDTLRTMADRVETQQRDSRAAYSALMAGQQAKMKIRYGRR